MRMASCICWILLISLFHEMIGAQEVTSGLARSKVTLGDQVVWICTTVISKGEQINFVHPDLSGREDVELVQIEAMRRLVGSSVDTIVQPYLIAVYDTGRIELPACRVIMTHTGEELVQSGTPQTMEVLVPQGASSQLDPLKDIERTPWQLTDLWYWMIGVTLLTILAYLYYRYKQRAKLAPIEGIVDPLPSPYERAMTSLDQLELPMKSDEATKRYYADCSDILRVYLEATTSVPAMERTTYETVTMLKTQVDDGLISTIGDWLSHIDRIKYADFRPASNEVDTAKERTRQLINLLWTSAKQEEE